MCSCKNNCDITNNECCECIEFKKEAQVLIQEAKGLRFAANENIKSAKDLLNTEEIFQQRINKLKEEAQREYEKSIQYENRYKECISIIKCKSCYGNCYWINMPNVTCEECLGYKNKSEDLKASALIKEEYIEALEEQKVLLYEIAVGYINDANIYNNEAQNKEQGAKEAMVKYEECKIEYCNK